MPVFAPLVAIVVLTLVALGPAPATAQAPAAATGRPAGAFTIHVASNGWHTAFVVARSDLPEGAIPEAADFPDASYLEFGWGDAEYFPRPDAGIGLALRAALTPTPAVMHVVGLTAPPRQFYAEAEVVDIRLAAAGFAVLVGYLRDSFARDATGRAAAAPGLYAFSRFYPATGEFHLFNTCNTWTARGLAAAGLAVTVSGTVRAEDLMAQLR